MPIYNSLIRNTILVIQNLHRKSFGQDVAQKSGKKAVTDLENLRESLNDTCVFITIHLNYIDKGDLRLGAVAEWL